MLTAQWKITFSFVTRLPILSANMGHHMEAKKLVTEVASVEPQL